MGKRCRLFLVSYLNNLATSFPLARADKRLTTLLHCDSPPGRLSVCRTGSRGQPWIVSFRSYSCPKMPLLTRLVPIPAYVFMTRTPKLQECDTMRQDR